MGTLAVLPSRPPPFRTSLYESPHILPITSPSSAHPSMSILTFQPSHPTLPYIPLWAPSQPYLHAPQISTIVTIAPLIPSEPMDDLF